MTLKQRVGQIIADLRGLIPQPDSPRWRMWDEINRIYYPGPAIFSGGLDLQCEVVPKKRRIHGTGPVA